ARYGGVVMSLSRFEDPDTSSFTAPEIVHRVKMKQHIGFVFSSDSPTRIEELLTETIQRIQAEFHAALPPAESVAH
ncbi:MAG: ATPase, partial [Gemmataceae bacterium]